jgi:hypothetical protein
MKILIAVMLVIVGVIHLLPLAGVLGAERLSALYGLRIDEPNLVILMRHRAVLFGLLGGYLLYAAFQPAHQRVALTAAWISVATFLYLALAAGGYNAAIARVFWADVIAALCLLIATVAMFLAPQFKR